MVLINCPFCGVSVTPLISGAGAKNLTIENTSVQCQSCGNMVPAVSGSYSFAEKAKLDELGRLVLEANLTRKDAKRIVYRIINAKDFEILRDTIHKLHPQISKAIDVAVKGEPKKSGIRWLYHLAAIVTIFAGLNSCSEHYNLDAILERLSSDRPELIEQLTDQRPKQEPGKHRPKKDVGRK